MYLLIIFLPLLGTIFASLTGRFIGGKGASIITTMCVTSSFLISCFAFYEVALMKSYCIIKMNAWITTEVYDLN
jgi:NADH-ubiquinone oxidoreductase chain 5